MTAKNAENNRNEAQISTSPQSKPKRLRVRGATRLSRACEKILRRDGDRIANALFNRAVEGNVSSAKLLLKIIEIEARKIRLRQRKAAEKQKLKLAKPVA